MNQDMKFAITLIIVGGVMSSLSTTNDWGGWIVALGILIGICA